MTRLGGGVLSYCCCSVGGASVHVLAINMNFGHYCGVFFNITNVPKAGDCKMSHHKLGVCCTASLREPLCNIAKCTVLKVLVHNYGCSICLERKQYCSDCRCHIAVMGLHWYELMPLKFTCFKNVWISWQVLLAFCWCYNQALIVRQSINYSSFSYCWFIVLDFRMIPT